MEKGKYHFEFVIYKFSSSSLVKITLETFPKCEIVSRYLICMADLLSKISAAYLNN